MKMSLKLWPDSKCTCQISTVYPSSRRNQESFFSRCLYDECSCFFLLLRSQMPRGPKSSKLLYRALCNNHDETRSVPKP